MATYYMNEAAFALPETPYVDKTMHSIATRLPGGGSLDVIILRRPMEVGKSLRESVDGHVATNEKRLSGFTLLDTTETTIAGASAIRIANRWRHEGKAFFQMQAHIAVDGTWMLIAATGPFAERAACEEAFEGIVQSLTWRTA